MLTCVECGKQYDPEGWEPPCWDKTTRRIRELESELARVRGLLQRRTEALQKIQMKYDTAGNWLIAEKALTEQGAESADIGKLYAADKSCTCTNEMGLRYRNAYHEKICLAESSLSSPPPTAAGDFELDFLQTCGIKDHVIREGDENTQLMLSELLLAYKFAASPELLPTQKKV